MHQILYLTYSVCSFDNKFSYLIQDNSPFPCISIVPQGKEGIQRSNSTKISHYEVRDVAQFFKICLTFEAAATRAFFPLSICVSTSDHASYNRSKSPFFAFSTVFHRTVNFPDTLQTQTPSVEDHVPSMMPHNLLLYTRLQPHGNTQTPPRS